MAAEHYGQVVRSFWTDPDVKRKLSVPDKALLLYFFTSPHGNMIGLYHCPLAYAAAESGVSEADVRRAIAGVLAPFVSYDEETEEVFVHAAAKHLVGEELKVGPKGEDKRIEGVRKLVRAAHSPRLVRLFLDRYNAPFNLNLPLPDERREAPSKPLPDPQEAPSEGLTEPLPSPSEAIAEQSKAKQQQEPSVRASRGRANGRSTHPPAGLVGPSYVIRAQALFKQYVGHFEFKQVGAALKPLVEADGDEIVLKAAEAFCKFAPYKRRDGSYPNVNAGEPKVKANPFTTPHDFAKSYAEWRDMVTPVGATA